MEEVIIRNIRKLLYLISLIGFASCNHNNDTNSKKSKESFQDWSCNVADGDVICHPAKWKEINTKHHYYASVDKTDKNRYFTVLKYDVKKDQVNAKRYLKEIYSQAMKDTIEKFEGFTVHELTFGGEPRYFGEYFTIYKGKQYLTYSTVFEDGGYLYDIALKVLKSESASYRSVFANILYKIRINNDLKFDETDEYEKKELLDISKL